MPMLPTIGGNPRAGQVLTATPTASAYQWLRCDPMGVNCVPIAMATGQTYTVTAADYGATIEVTEVPTGGGTAVTSLPTAVVPAPPAIVAAPTIGGSPVEGQTLTETRGMWTGAPTSYAQQWETCDAGGGGCLPIAGATTQTYVVAAADIGHTIRVNEQASNGEGPSLTVAASNATAVVTGFPPRNTAPPTISGLGQIGSTLTCATGTWTGTQPISYAYQWLGDGNPIAGATGPTHALAPTDVALAEACAVTATNAAGRTTEKSDSILVTAATQSCGGFTGGALRRCRAKAAYKLARARCSTISTKTKAGRSRRAACTAKAKLTYKRALAVAKCQSIKSSKQRAACVARARKIKK